MKNSHMITIIIGCLAVFWQLWPVLNGELMPNVFILWVGILCIISGVYNNRDCYDKNYFVATFSGIIVGVLMLLYIFLFRTDEYLKYNTYVFYMMLGAFILFLISYGKFYIRVRNMGALKEGISFEELKSLKREQRNRIDDL
jgi:hypothetical protein